MDFEKEMPDDYLAKIPPLYRSTAYVVGGAATCLRLAQDVDIVILTEASLQGLQEEFAVDARLYLSKFIPAQRTRSDYQTAIKAAIGTLSSPYLEKDIHLLLSNVATVQEVLDAFDLSIHQFAIDSLGQRFAGTNATASSAPIKVLKYDTPESTLARYIRLCTRYGLGMESAILDSLRLQKEVF